MQETASYAEAREAQFGGLTARSNQTEEAMENIAHVIAAATEARARVLDRIRGLSSAQGAFKPDPAEWSIAENVEHLVLAEQGSLNRVWAAADGLRHGQPTWTGKPARRGKSIQQIVAETSPQRQQAPDIAMPRRRGPLGRCHPMQSAAA